MQNINTTTNAGVSCLYGFNTYSQSSDGTKFPTGANPYWIAKLWKDTKEIIIPSRPNPSSDSQAFVILEGNYTPGQAKRSVTNDGDVKRWTRTQPKASTNAPLPEYQEDLHLMFFPASFAENISTAVRVQIEMTYTIQFKEPYDDMRYPNEVSANIVTTTANAYYSYV
jgi:hypothetical protein